VTERPDCAIGSLRSEVEHVYFQWERSHCAIVQRYTIDRRARSERDRSATIATTVSLQVFELHESGGRKVRATLLLSCTFTANGLLMLFTCLICSRFSVGFCDGSLEAVHHDWVTALICTMPLNSQDEKCEKPIDHSNSAQVTPPLKKSSFDAASN
jgi:hypothetical protein